MSSFRGRKAYLLLLFIFVIVLCQGCGRKTETAGSSAQTSCDALLQAIADRGGAVRQSWPAGDTQLVTWQDPATATDWQTACQGSLKQAAASDTRPGWPDRDANNIRSGWPDTDHPGSGGSGGTDPKPSPSPVPPPGEAP